MHLSFRLGVRLSVCPSVCLLNHTGLYLELNLVLGPYASFLQQNFLPLRWDFPRNFTAIGSSGVKTVAYCNRGQPCRATLICCCSWNR